MPNLNKYHKMLHVSQDSLPLPLMLLVLDILTVMLKIHGSTRFLLEVMGLSVCFASAFPDSNIEQILRWKLPKLLKFAQNTLVWEHSLTSPWMCTVISCSSWWPTWPSHSHLCCFSSSGAAKMEGLKISSPCPPTYLHSITFHLVLKQKGKVSRKRKQLPKEDIRVDNKRKKAH